MSQALPPGFQIDPKLSQQEGVPVAVNPTTGKRIKLRTGPGKLTQDEGQAQGYARLMVDAEGNYKKARQEGYDPNSLRNVAGSFFEGLGPLARLGPMIRDDVGDRAQQAQMVWADAQLKAMSGAASPPSEVRDNMAKFFPQFGENLNLMDPQKEASRRAAFDSARIRSGPAGTAIKPPVGGKPAPPQRPGQTGARVVIDLNGRPIK